MFRLLLSKQSLAIRQSTCRFLKRTKYTASANDLRCFSISSNDPGLRMDSNNVFCSPFPKVGDSKNLLLHELIWMDVNKWANKTAVVCSATGRSYTYEQLRKLTGRLATSLRKAKLYPRDTIALVLPNIPEYALIILAASEAGLRTTLVNFMYTTVEIVKQLKDSEALAVFTIPQIYPIIKQSIQNNPHIKLPVIVVNDGSGPIPTDAINLDDLMRDDIEEFAKNEQSNIHSEDDVFLPYSSGTTGLPKGVQLSHRNVVMNLKQVGCPELYPGITTSETEQDVIPLILPVFHIYGLIVCLCGFLRMGAKLVCVPQFSVSAYIKILENYNPTLLYLVPPIVQTMALNENITSRHVEKVRLIISGAAPIGEESISIFRKRVSDSVGFIQGYGLTETSPVVSLSKNASSKSVGYIIPNTQVRIVKHDDNCSENLKPNEVGEIYVRGPQVMKGYFKNPQATSDTMDNDWLKTGDLGQINDAGLLHIEGRFKELIKVKGFQVAPAELEDIIRGLEDKIQDVAVIGVPHEKFGEIPKAFVVPKKGVTVTAEEIKNYVAKNVAEYKQLGYVQYIEKIPKSAAGKILRRELQKM